MDTQDSLGGRLRALKERSGLSLQQIADAMGAKSRSAVQRYFEDDWRPNGYLHLEEAIKLGSALVGHGDPPIVMDDIFNLTALPQVPIRRADQVPPLSPEVVDVLAETLGLVAAGRELSASEKATLGSIIQGMSELFRTDLPARQNPEMARGALRLLALQHGLPNHGLH
jgi:hypothetical protein